MALTIGDPARFSPQNAPAGLAIIARYTFVYWICHLGQFLIIFGGFFTAFYLGVVEELWYKIIPRALADVRAKRFIPRLRKFFYVTSILAQVLLVCVIPQMHIYYPGWARFLIFILPIPLVATTYYGLNIPIQQYRRRLGRYRYSDKSFNVAALGTLAFESQTEIGQYSELVERFGYMHEDTRKFIELGSADNIWRGNQALFRNVAQLIGRGADEIRLFDRTTDAIIHALRECVRGKAAGGISANALRVLYTDAEYPTIRQSIETELKEASFGIAAIGDDFWGKKADQVVTDRFVSAAQALKGKIDILVCFHVHYCTGRVLPLAAILRKLRELGAIDSGTQIIVDGAQAVGNIDVSGGMLDDVNYYAFCGHKWLLGSPTLGMLFTNSKDPRNPSLALERGYSEFGAVGAREGQGSINLFPHLSLNTMLAEFRDTGSRNIEKHNAALAELFDKNLDHTGMMADSVYMNRGGIVTIKTQNREAMEKLVLHLQKNSIASTPYPDKNAVRFCFHYYHNENDVYALLEKLSEIA